MTNMLTISLDEIDELYTNKTITDAQLYFKYGSLKFEILTLQKHAKDLEHLNLNREYYTCMDHLETAIFLRALIKPILIKEGYDV